MRTMKYLLYILPIILLGSCSVQQMNNYHCKRCPTKDSTYVKVELRDSVVPRDSIVFIPRDSFVINFKDSVPCKDFEAEGEDSKGNRAKIKVKDGKASAECECAEYKTKIHWLEHHTTKVFKSHRTLTRTIYEKSKAGKFYVWFFWIVIILIVLRITFFILKKTGVFPISIKRSG